MLEQRNDFRLCSTRLLNMGQRGHQFSTGKPRDDRTPDALWLFCMAHPWKQLRKKRRGYDKYNPEDPETCSSDQYRGLSDNGRCSNWRQVLFTAGTIAARADRVGSHDAH